MIRVLSLLTILLAMAIQPARAEQAPACFIITVSLAGEDAERRSAIIRNGAELAPKIMMPLFAGDVVFLRDPASRIGIEMGDGKAVEITGSSGRYEVAGEIDTGDSTWSIIASIGGLIGGEDALPPDNMVSKGGALKVPMARRDGNLLLRGHSKLWLAWTGGDAPYALSLSASGKQHVLLEGLAGSDVEIDLPPQLPDRFSLTLSDARGQKSVMRFRFADGLPAGLPDDNGTAGRLARAAWLTAQSDGAWSVEAAQILRTHPSGASNALLARIREGWTYR